jgi:hypothetical protein
MRQYNWARELGSSKPEYLYRSCTVYVIGISGKVLRITRGTLPKRNEPLAVESAGS